MNKRTFTSLIILALVLSQSSPCYGFLQAVQLGMKVIPLGKQLFEFFSARFRVDEKPDDKTGQIISKIDDVVVDFKHDIATLTYRLELDIANLPAEVNLVGFQQRLQEDTEYIADKYSVLMNLQKKLNNKTADYLHETFITQTRIKDDQQNCWDRIKNMFKQQRALSYLTGSFFDTKKLLENVCKARVSQRQLIEELFLLFQIVSVQYFFSKHILYNYFESYHKTPEVSKIYELKRETFNGAFSQEYNDIVDIFKRGLNSSSPKLWSCDTIDPHNPFYVKMEAFTQFYSVQLDFHMDFGDCSYKCLTDNENASQDVLDDCMRNKCYDKNTELRCPKVDYKCTASEIRGNNRRCSEPLVQCKLMAKNAEKIQVCAKEDPKALKRYYTVDHAKSCEHGRSYQLEHILDPAIQPLSCVCPEKKYYISTTPAQADEGYVIVGAQLQITNDNILYIRIKQGKPTVGGNIDLKTVEWKVPPVNIAQSERIGFDYCNEFDLSETKLPKNRVIAGLSLVCEQKRRIHLNVHSVDFDLQTGTLGEHNIEKFIPGTKLYNLHNFNVSSTAKFLHENKPIDLSQGDYVAIALSNLKNDAGQTTIPFVDIQEVAPATPVALSGISFILRGQKGYGGYLAIQLFTFDITPHLPPREELDQSEIKKVLLAL